MCPMMRPSLASLLLLLACLRAAGQYFTAVPEDEGVIVLTKDTLSLIHISEPTRPY